MSNGISSVIPKGLFLLWGAGATRLVSARHCC